MGSLVLATVLSWHCRFHSNEAEQCHVKRQHSVWVASTAVLFLVRPPWVEFVFFPSVWDNNEAGKSIGWIV